MNSSPVFQIMSPKDTYDIVLISTIDTLLKILIGRSGDSKFRESRLCSMHDLLHKIEPSYKGYIPDAYINRSQKFVKMMHTDMSSLLEDIKKIKDAK
jgi:hypothetical protein